MKRSPAFYAYSVVIAIAVASLGPSIPSAKAETVASKDPMQTYAGMLSVLQSEKAQASLLMKQINDIFHDNIDEISYTLGKEIFPLVIIHTNSSQRDQGTFSYTCYKRDGSMETVPAHTQEETHIKYAVHHIPALLAISLPVFQNEGKTNFGWMAEYRELDSKMVALSACLDQTDISPEGQKLLTVLLNDSHAFIQESLEAKQISEARFSAYVEKIKPNVLALLGVATSGFNARITAVFQRWKDEVGDAEWKKVQVLVQSSLALRKEDENPYLTPLKTFLGKTFRDDQIIVTTNTSFNDAQLRNELGHYFASSLVSAFVLPTHPGEDGEE